MLRTTYLAAAIFGVATAASAQSYDDFIAIGDATTKQNKGLTQITTLDDV